ncbi:MAG TPA: Stp1/IreP family PP2C-type Ser/Thr phosphatase [Syntrophomonadaceae bacterium]|nr:Stp1/IreP family PP2C-type Ser/Thr phosphatase [Syntrophomonadaceae bacterium]
MKVVGISDVGLVRQKNEDAFWIDENQGLFLVCDGMGGHRGGEVASHMAVQTIIQSMKDNSSSEAQQRLVQAIETANQAILKAGLENEHLFEMGTTVTAVLVDGSRLLVANVGDSGVFLIRSNTIRKITRDHTLAEEMLSHGILKPEEMRGNAYNHILTRALGVDDQVEIDIFNEELLPGDILLIYSDGLTDMLIPDEILEIIQANSSDLEIAADRLVRKALQKGGFDNVTIVLLCFN